MIEHNWDKIDSEVSLRTQGQEIMKFQEMGQEVKKLKLITVKYKVADIEAEDL